MIAALAGHHLARVTPLDCGSLSLRGGERLIGIPAFLLTTGKDPAAARVLGDRRLALRAAAGARLICRHEPAGWPALPRAPEALR